MYFLRYKIKSQVTLGFMDLEKSKILPLTSLKEFIDISKMNTMNDLIDNLTKDDISLIQGLLSDDSMNFDLLENVEILSPIEYSKRNLICLGVNYQDHRNEVKGSTNIKNDKPKFPVYFSKICYPSIGPNDNIIYDTNVTTTLDYEVELAIIIGKKGKNISQEEASDYIFGYTIVNDISARDLQFNNVQWHRGKSIDTFCSIGPYIIQSSDIDYPVDLEIKCWVNDELRQNSRTSNLIFDIDYIISDLSNGITLYPGDIIITGTPGGVGMGFTPPKYLKSGDVVKCEIEKIGTLINYVK